MTDWKLPWTAHCRCERTALEITQPPWITMACHCTGCQRMSASAFSLSIAFPAAGVTVSRGEPVIGGLHGGSRHFHCEYCKSWMFTRPEGMDEMINVRATMLDDHTWVSPFVETWVSEGFAWARTGASHRFAKLPDERAWGPLIAEFAAKGPRPT